MIAIDTLAYTKALIAGGFTAEQAEVQANTLNQTLNESLKEEIATQADIAKVESRIDSVESKIDLVESKIDSTRWVLGMILAVNVVMLGVMLSKFY